MSASDPAIMAAFREELQAKMAALRPLRAASETPPLDPALLRSFFELSHFLSGYGGAVGYPFLSEVGRELEAFSSALLKGSVAVGTEVIGTLKETCAALEEVAREALAGTLDGTRHARLHQQILRIQRELRQAGTEEPADAADAAATRRKVLVVDDEQLSQVLIAGALRNAGYQVVSCLSAREGLRLLDEEKPDLVILDVVMPDMDGFEFLKKLRAGEGLIPVPVVFVTTRSQLQEKLKGIKIGADDYLTKPFLPEELVSRVGARIERYENLKNLATRDALTGLYNHRYFQERLNEEIRRYDRYKRPFSVSLLDIDRFKLINDTHGHLVGDMILRGFSEFMRSHLRAADVLARYGGDEFVAIFPETEKPAATHALDVLRDRVRLDFPPAGSDVPRIPLAFSAGIASCPQDGSARAELLEHADAALYRAKEGGRDRVEAWQSAS